MQSLKRWDYDDQNMFGSQRCSDVQRCPKHQNCSQVLNKREKAGGDAPAPTDVASPAKDAGTRLWMSPRRQRDWENGDRGITYITVYPTIYHWGWFIIGFGTFIGIRNFRHW
jgi:hypothetical protein